MKVVKETSWHEIAVEPSEKVHLCRGKEGEGFVLLFNDLRITGLSSLMVAALGRQAAMFMEDFQEQAAKECGAVLPEE